MTGSVEQPPASAVVTLPARRDPARRAHPGLDAAGVRLVLRALLFEGSSVPAWHDDAACANRPRSLFFSEIDGLRSGAASMRAAKQVCLRCPVRATCLEDVMAYESPSYRYGIVAGLSPAERHRLHRAPLEATS